VVKIPLIFQSAEIMEKQGAGQGEVVFYKGEKIVPKEEFKKDK
jgi:hypothetical protein